MLVTRTPAKKAVAAKKAAPKAEEVKQPKQKSLYRIGNLTRDPELRFTATGKAVCNVGLAYNPYNRETKEQKEPIFYNLVIWEGLGEHVAQSLTKGMRVVVCGRPQINKWEGEDGEIRTSKEIVVDGIGPDLRFAVISPEAIERTEGGEGYYEEPF